MKCLLAVVLLLLGCSDRSRPELFQGGMYECVFSGIEGMEVGDVRWYPPAQPRPEARIITVPCPHCEGCGWVKPKENER